MVPAVSLENKFTYFYRPYNYEVNTDKFMTFEDNICEEKREHLKDLEIE